MFLLTYNYSFLLKAKLANKTETLFTSDSQMFNESGTCNVYICAVQNMYNAKDMNLEQRILRILREYLLGCPANPSHKFGFRSSVQKNGLPGEGKYEGLVPRNDVLTSGFIRVAFHSTKNSGLKFRKFHVLNGTVHSGCTDPTQATARFVIVASQHTHNYALKVKSKQ